MFSVVLGGDFRRFEGLVFGRFWRGCVNQKGKDCNPPSKPRLHQRCPQHTTSTPPPPPCHMSRKKHDQTQQILGPSTKPHQYRSPRHPTHRPPYTHMPYRHFKRALPYSTHANHTHNTRSHRQTECDLLLAASEAHTQAGAAGDVNDLPMPTNVDGEDDGADHDDDEDGSGMSTINAAFFGPGPLRR